MRIAVIGAGSWGTAVAALATENADVVLWARRPELADAIARDHENPDYLAGYRLPDIATTSVLGDALDGADVMVMGVPSHGYRAVLEAAGTSLSNVVKTTVFLADMGEFKAMNGVFAGFFPGAPPARSAIQAAALPLGARIEIEAIAVVP